MLRMYSTDPSSSFSSASAELLGGRTVAGGRTLFLLRVFGLLPLGRLVRTVGGHICLLLALEDAAGAARLPDVGSFVEPFEDHGRHGLGHSLTILGVFLPFGERLGDRHAFRHVLGGVSLAALALAACCTGGRCISDVHGEAMVFQPVGSWAA